MRKLSYGQECQFHTNCGGWCETKEEIEHCLCADCLQAEKDEEDCAAKTAKEFEQLRAQLKRTEEERNHFRECMYEVGAEAAKLKTELLVLQGDQSNLASAETYMPALSEEELLQITGNDLYWDHHFGYSDCHAVDMARAVEAAMLAKATAAQSNLRELNTKLLAALTQVRDWDDDRQKLGQMAMPLQSRAVIDRAIFVATKGNPS